MHIDHVDIGGRQQYQLLLGALAVARRDPDAIALGGKRMADMPSDKPGTA
jgi:hypothetical protein